MVKINPIKVKLVRLPNIQLDDVDGGTQDAYTFEVHGEGWTAVLVRKGASTKEQATERAKAFRAFFNKEKKAIESGKKSPYNIMATPVGKDGIPMNRLFDRKIEAQVELDI